MNRKGLLPALAFVLVLAAACAGSPDDPAPSPAAPVSTAVVLPPAPGPANPADVPPSTPLVAEESSAKPLPAGPLAPEILSETWLNSPRLGPADLRGHPVLVEFWALGCINCIRSVPAMKALHELYKEEGLIVIGVHTPEFDREKELERVRAAVQKLQLPYPVAIDNDLAIWNAFDNQYWPALYLIDKRGVLRTTHIGELHADTPAWGELTGLVEDLLAEPG